MYDVVCVYLYVCMMRVYELFVYTFMGMRMCGLEGLHACILTQLETGEGFGSEAEAGTAAVYWNIAISKYYRCGYILS